MTLNGANAAADDAAVNDATYTKAPVHLLLVSVKNTPPEKKTVGKMSFQSTKAGAGLQFLPLDCMAKANIQVVVVH